VDIHSLSIHLRRHYLARQSWSSVEESRYVPIGNIILLRTNVHDANLQDSRYSEWADQYIAYGQLKKEIKGNLPWNDTAEANFIQSLKNELEKCEKFQRSKAEQLMVKIDDLEKEVLGLVEKASEEDDDDE